MSFWFVVRLALIGVPCVLFVSGMGMIFAAAGHANGGDVSRGHAIFAWPDAPTGWTHTAGITAVLAAAMVAEVVVRKLRKQRER